MNKRSIVHKMTELINQGKKFTFQNFCYPDEEFPGEYGGKDKPDWITWKTRSYNIINENTSADSAPNTLAVRAINIHTEGETKQEFSRLQETLIQGLELAIDSIRKDAYGELKKQQNKGNKGNYIIRSKKVFVVHGHDHALKMELEKFLSDIGLEPIVLHREADEGLTLIEKFERHSDVGYAFVLFTPDEIAYAKDQEKFEDEKRKKELRARPNVVLEFGFFVGKLGRQRVCCVSKEEVVLPTDMSGLLYKKVNHSISEKAYEFMKELKVAGYEVKMK